MKKVLEYYFDESLATNQEQKKEKQEKKEAFFQSLRTFFASCFGDSSVAFIWLQSMMEIKKYGYQLLVKEYGKGAEQAEVLAKNVGFALAELEQEKAVYAEYPLAVLAAKVSGNPHYFDRGTLAGQLLVNAISCYQGVEIPKSAHKWRELLQQAGTSPDNVSSLVHGYGLRLRMSDGYHPAFELFCQRREPYVITLENLKCITGAEAVGAKAFVVENEMVFSYLLEHLKEKEVTVLCTSGQPRTAALKLISFLISNGTKLYYSGDIDPEGMDIADRLWREYGESICIWRMELADYEKSISEERIDDIRLAKLERIQNPQLMETAKQMKEKKLSAYQENILDDLLGDILRLGDSL